ncbi:Contactin-Associated Protein 1 [Manis pentadactyla]|nr:Contactin-Associated Protein 1 [Manis pentadactyla]
MSSKCFVKWSQMIVQSEKHSKELDSGEGNCYDKRCSRKKCTIQGNCVQKSEPRLRMSEIKAVPKGSCHLAPLLSQSLEIYYR